jgi:hypothetical protein
MERELQRQRHVSPGGDGSGGGAGDGVEDVRTSLDAILAEADRILDGLRPVNAEEYLQQNRQRGGQ